VSKRFYEAYFFWSYELIVELEKKVADYFWSCPGF
jgi:hypothetical protein